MQEKRAIELSKSVIDIGTNSQLKGHFSLSKGSISISLTLDEQFTSFYGRYVERTLPSSLKILIRTPEELFNRIASADNQSLFLSEQDELAINLKVDGVNHLYCLPLLKVKNNMLKHQREITSFLSKMIWQQVKNLRASIEMQKYKMRQEIQEFRQQRYALMTLHQEQKIKKTYELIQKRQEIANLKKCVLAYQNIVFNSPGFSGSDQTLSIDQLIALQNIWSTQMQKPDPLLTDGPENVTISAEQYLKLKISASTISSINHQMEYESQKIKTSYIELAKDMKQIIISLKNATSAVQEMKGINKELLSIVREKQNQH